jgi:hypothetical protein
MSFTLSITSFTVSCLTLRTIEDDGGGGSFLHTKVYWSNDLYIKYPYRDIKTFGLLFDCLLA